MNSELRRKIRHRTRAQNSGMGCAPSPVRLQVFLLAAIRVVDAAMQDQFARAAFERGERHLIQQRDRIVIQLAPANRVEIAKQDWSIRCPSSTIGFEPATTAALARER